MEIYENRRFWFAGLEKKALSLPVAKGHTTKVGQFFIILLAYFTNMFRNNAFSSKALIFEECKQAEQK